MLWSDFWKNLIIGLIPALIVVAAAIVTLKQFYSQKWWERKEEAYSKIIGDLTNLLYSTEEVSEAEERAEEANDKPNKEYIDKLIKIYSDSSETIRKTAIAGDYIISRNSSLLLKTFTKKINEVGRYPLSFDAGEEYRLLNDCLENIRQEAKKDLKVYGFRDRWNILIEKIRNKRIKKKVEK